MKSTAIANSNIAFVKYWGKRDNELNLPMNPSISMTLDENISTKTTTEFSGEYDEDVFILNNELQTGNRLKRVSDFLDRVREKAGSELKAKIVSVNSFPTGSGIASSASGFAALAAASSKALGLELSHKELSSFARRGSGSAARSIYGGFCEWKDEHAVQLNDENHWPELRDIVVIVSKEEKPLGSREGMKKTVETSELYKERINNISLTLEKVRRAIAGKDFDTLAKEIMRDSDNMHACMKDTIPSIVYLTEASERIKRIIIGLNKTKTIAAYTFDAGPNAHIITLKKHLPEITKELNTLENISTIVSGAGQGVRESGNHLF